MPGFAAFGLTREDWSLALVGGVVTDIAGFAAASITAASPSCPCRLPARPRSTPRSAARPGSTFPEGKNLVGAFWQPVG